MTTNYYQNLFLDLNQEHQPYDEEPNLSLNLYHVDPMAASSSSSLSPSSPMSPSYFNRPPQDQDDRFLGSKPLLVQDKVIEDVFSYGAALESKRQMNSLKFRILKREDKIDNNHDHDGYHHRGEHQNGGSSSPSSIKWVSSKMRVLRKMTKFEDHSFGKEASNNYSTTNNFKDHKLKIVSSPKDISASNSTDINSPTTRFCADCNTTRTPLWRSGPQGPKTLCNACGIRQRKARRAAMAELNLDHKEPITQQKKKQLKTKSKPIAQNDDDTQIRKLCFEEFAISLSKKLSLHQIFPPDEKEAAILLMAMSCGLVEG